MHNVNLKILYISFIHFVATHLWEPMWKILRRWLHVKGGRSNLKRPTDEAVVVDQGIAQLHDYWTHSILTTELRVSTLIPMAITNGVLEKLNWAHLSTKDATITNFRKATKKEKKPAIEEQKPFGDASLTAGERGWLPCPRLWLGATALWH